MKTEDKTICFAGAASIFGIKDIKESLLRQGYKPIFIETPFMMKFVHDGEDEIIVTDNLVPSDIYIPLNEYFVTKCCDKHIINISSDAFKCARSKMYLSEILKNNDIAYCHYFLDKDQAREYVINNNAQLIIKPNASFSGYSVKYIDKNNLSSLDEYIETAKVLSKSCSYVFHETNTLPMISEYIKGDEYSCDVLIKNGKINIVRIVRKIVTIINNNPVVLVNTLVKPALRHIKAITSWMKVIFNHNDFSFAQFDYIDNGIDLIPIDFSSRVGGGLIPLYQFSKTNYYLNVLNGKSYDLLDNHLFTQLNYVPSKQGILQSNDYLINEGKTILYFHKGDMIKGNIASADLRLANEFKIIDKFEDNFPYLKYLVIGGNNIE